MKIECKGRTGLYGSIEHNERFIRDGKEYTKLYKRAEDGKLLVDLAYTEDGDVEFFSGWDDVMKIDYQQTELKNIRGGQVFLYESNFYIRIRILDVEHSLTVINLSDGNISCLNDCTLVEEIDAKLVNA